MGSKHAYVDHKLVGVVHDLLGQVGYGSGVSVCNGVIDMTPDDLGVGWVYALRKYQCVLKMMA